MSLGVVAKTPGCANSRSEKEKPIDKSNHPHANHGMAAKKKGTKKGGKK